MDHLVLLCITFGTSSQAVAQLKNRNPTAIPPPFASGAFPPTKIYTPIKSCHTRFNPHPLMSTSTVQTAAEEHTNPRSRDPHRTKKRKHVDNQEEAGAGKKKKPKKLRLENGDRLAVPEAVVKKPRTRHLSPSGPTDELRPTSPTHTDVPDSNPLTLDDHAPEPLAADPTTPQDPLTPSLLDSTISSPFHSVRLSLYLPLSAISLSPSTALASLQAEHLAPLLLTYSAPARGVILAFTDTVVSSTRPEPSSPPSPHPAASGPILARCADDYGTSYVWLTTTFLVFRPTSGETLSGWINVASDSFIGLVAYNYFQAGVARLRIAKDWRWVGPGSEARKRSKRKKIRIRSPSHSDEGAVDIDMDAEHMTQTPAEEDQVEDDYDGTGYFVRPDGGRVTGTMQFRVIDADVVPGHDRERWSLQLEGTLLTPEDEAAVVEEERVQDEKVRARGKSGTIGQPGLAVHTPGWNAAMMSGGLRSEDRRRRVSLSQTPVPSSARR